MSFLHGTEEYYQKFIELQEKLRKSEEERLKLEMKFNEMVQVSREEEQIYYRKLRAQYKRFLEEDRRRQERNERILRILERIESRAAMLAAKTQRFELLRKQYHAYLRRVFTNVKQQDEAQVPPRMPTIAEQKQPQNELVRSPKVDVVKQYLSSLSSPTCREEVLKAARSNELQPFSDASSEDYNLPKYKSNASNLADQIIHSIHTRPKTDPHPEEGRGWQSFCGTKLSPPRPPTRKSDDVELLDYGGAGDQYQFGGKRRGDDFDFLNQLLEEEKIVQDNYQNEKFFYPREKDVRPSVRFEDHYLPVQVPVEEVDFPKPEVPEDTSPKKTALVSTIPKRPDLHVPTAPKRVDYPQEPAMAESKDYEEEPRANEEVKSNENSEEEQHFEDKSQKPESESPKANGDGVEITCFEDGEGRIGEEDHFKGGVQPAAESQNGGDEAIDQIEEDVQGEAKSTPQSDQNDEVFVKGEVAVNGNQNEVEDQGLVYGEDKKKENEVQDDVEETNAQFGNANYDETVQYASNEGEQPFQGDQPIQYDEHGQPIQYDEQGQVIQYDEHGRAIQYDEHGQAIHYDEQGQPVVYDNFNQYDEQGRPIHYDEHGQPIPYDEHVQPIQYDEHGRPIQYDEQGRPTQYDEQGRPIQYDEEGRPIHYDEKGHPIPYDEQDQPIQYGGQGRSIQYDEQGQPIPYDEHDRPIQYDEHGRPIQYDEEGRPIQYDEEGRPVHYDEKGQYDEQGRPIQYDEQGRPIQYDEHGHPIQYDEQGQYYDEQGQPLYQYDPNSDYYQQQQQQQYEELGLDGQQNQDKIGSSEVIEKGEADAVVQPQNDRGEEGQLQNERGKEGQSQNDERGKEGQLQKERGKEGQPQNERGKEGEDKKEEGELEMPKQKPNVMDMLDTDTESTRQEAKVSNDSDFDFSNS